MLRFLYFPNTSLTRLTLLVASLQGIIVIGLESYVFVTVQNDLDPAAFQVPTGRTVRLYLSLFILAYVFQFGIIYDALRLSSMIQVVGVCIYNLFLLAYAVVQPVHIQKDLNTLSESLVLGVRPILPPDLNTWSRVQPFLWIVTSVQAVATVAMFCLAFKLHSELAWLVYKVINADLSIRRRLLHFQIYITLIKFDYFLLLSFLVQVATLLVDPKDPEFLLSILGTLVAAVVACLAVYCARAETRLGTMGIIALYVSTIAYLAYKLPFAIKRTNYLMILMAATTMFMMTGTVLAAVRCIANFDKGLKRYVVTGQKIPEDGMHLHYTKQTMYAPPSPRMEID